MVLNLLEAYNDLSSDSSHDKGSEAEEDTSRQELNALPEQIVAGKCKRVLPVENYKRHKTVETQSHAIFSLVERVEVGEPCFRTSPLRNKQQSSLLRDLPEPLRWVIAKDCHPPSTKNLSTNTSRSDAMMKNGSLTEKDTVMKTTSNLNSCLSKPCKKNEQDDEEESRQRLQKPHPLRLSEDKDDTSEENVLAEKSLFSFPTPSNPEDDEKPEAFVSSPSKTICLKPPLREENSLCTSRYSNELLNVTTMEEHVQQVPASSLPKGREWKGYLFSEQFNASTAAGGPGPKLFEVNSKDLVNSDWRDAFSRGDGRLKPKFPRTSVMPSLNVTLAPSRRQRQKNQINFLAQEVANKEHEFSERASQQRYSKYQTQMKYGW